MNLPTTLLLSFLLLAGALRGALPEDLRTDAHRIAPGAPGQAWVERIGLLRGNPPLRASFEEHRHFPFRKEASRLEGVLRLDPELGMSLSYSRPAGLLMVVDREGAFVREPRKPRREVPDVASARAALSALLAVLAFDLPAVDGQFEVFGAHDGEAWQLEFVPRAGVLDGVLHPIRVGGEGALVKRIDLLRSEKSRVEIFLGETETGVTFTEEERKRNFR